MRWLQKSLTFVICLSSTGLLCSPAQQPAATRNVGAPPPDQALQAGAYFALVIGNNHYRHLGASATLATPIHDATEVADVLHTRYGFQTRLLLDADRGQILSALVSYRKTLPPDANLLIYYAGHGYHDKAADQAYWLPADADRENNANWISSDDITRDITAIPARHILVIADSCYSGFLARARSADISMEAADRGAYLAKIVASRSRMLMSSGSDEPVSDGGPDGHSVFAAALLKSLRTMPRESFTGSELFYEFLQPGVGGSSAQLPQYDFILRSGHEYGDFLFSKDPSTLPTVKVTTLPPKAPFASSASPPSLPVVAWVASRNGYILHWQPVSGWKPQMFRQSGLMGDAVSFPDPLSGYVATTKTLLRTNDGGKSWYEALNSEGLGSVSFVDAQSGWIIANKSLLHTVDAGKNWSTQLSNKLTSVDRVIFVTPMQGWIVGAIDKILHTTDGGKSWAPQQALGTMDIYTSASFVDTQTGWVVGTSGAILHTGNGGNAWTRQTSGTDALLLSVSFINSQEGWIAGARGVLLHTSDGGMHWTKQNSGTTNYLRSVRFSTPQLGLAAGDGIILATADGGMTWTPQYEDEYDTFSSIAVFPDPDR